MAPFANQAEHSFTNIDLFAGGGGSALGLENSGFHSLGALEIDPHACQTLRINRPNWNVVEGDIDELTQDMNRFAALFPEAGNLDLLFFGAPCQAFSYAGKRLGIEDTRGTLFYNAAKVLELFMPKCFVFENVKGLLSHDGGRTYQVIQSVFAQLGYHIKFQVLNAWDYGVSQKRERLITVGVRNDIHTEYQFPTKHNYRPVLRDALKNVPKSDGQLFSSAKAEVMQLVPPGGSWVDLPDDVARAYMGKSYFSGGGRRGMARRIAWDEPSLTLTTSPSQKQTERAHPDENRPFTVREYARIQSFPDEWSFCGSLSAQYKQIGNAVPVKLAQEIGNSVVEFLNQATSQQSQPGNGGCTQPAKIRTQNQQAAA
jgi:DNA (cytosine-5)-methyltransferase 1